MGEIAGKRKGVTISLPKQKDAAYMWKGASIHPMQALQNIHQRTVREAVRLVEGDDARRDEAGKQLGGFFYFEAAGPKLLPPLDPPLGPDFIEERVEAVTKSLERLQRLIKLAANLREEVEAGDSIRKLLKDAYTELSSILKAIPRRPEAAVQMQSDLLASKVDLDKTADDDLEQLKQLADAMQVLAGHVGDLIDGLACVANFHVIDTFYLWRLLVKYQFTSDKEIDSDRKADLSGEVTGLLHNGKDGATAWLTEWLTKKLVELDKALKELDKDNLFFYLKGGRALYYAMGTKELGTNDFDTGIIINPNLPVGEWYELFRNVHNLCLCKLRRFKHELIALMADHADDFSRYLDAVEKEDAKGKPDAAEGGEGAETGDYDDHDKELQAKRIADLLQQLEPPDERTNGKAELIDIGMPRRDTPEVWETWALKPAAMTAPDGMPFPGPLYFINEYVMMIRDAFQPKSRSGKKSGKRLKRLSDLLKTTVPDAAVAHEVQHMPAWLLSKSLAALKPFGNFDKAAKVLLKQFVDAHLLREDAGFCQAFDDYFVAQCGQPGETPLSKDLTDAAGKLGADAAAALAVAKNVGCIHAFSGKIEKHIKDRGEFFRRNRKEFGRFVKAIYTASIFNKAEDELEIMFAIAGSFAARLHVEYADYEHMEDVEPFHRLDLKVYCRGDADPDVVMEVVVPSIVEAYKAHPETPEYIPSVAPGGALNLYWPTEEMMGELTYRPLVIRLSVEKRTRDWPQLAFVWGYPVLSIRDLVWDYIREAGQTEEFGAKARLRKTSEALAEILTRYENPGAKPPGSAPVTALPPVDPLPPEPPETRREVAGMQRIPQEKPNWCWAAASQIMRRLYGGEDISQQDIVNGLHGNTNDQQGPLVLTGLTYSNMGQGVALSWDQIKAEIDRDHPFLFASGAHYYVATGYVERGASRYLLYWNPLPVNIGTRSQMSYQTYVTTTHNGGATYSNFSGPAIH